MAREMTFARVYELLRRFTYKPNFTIEVMSIPRHSSDPHYRPSQDDQAAISVVMYVPDSTQPFRSACHIDTTYDETHIFSSDGPVREFQRERIMTQPVIPVGAKFYVPLALGEREFWVWLRGCLRSMEDHELDEWFKVDGKVVNDPHGNDR